jgi:prepilin-type N-terminal cleavage/methylation domain-containing protein
MERPSIVTRVSPKDPSPARRSGFTLVELLAVIMIIALLAGLLTPAVMRSLSSSRAAAVKAEIELLNTALMNYKNEYGTFPPSDMRGLWDTTASPPQVNRNHPVYKHLKRCFPRLAEVEKNDFPNNGNRSPYYWMAQMSPAQALVFWLQGFFENPLYPLTNGAELSNSVTRAGTASANRTKLFDFDESRLYAAAGGVVISGGPTFGYWNLASPWVPPSAQTFAIRNAAPGPFARDYPVYFPNQANTGLPYVYFSSGNYSTAPVGTVTAAIGPGASPDIYYTATSLAGDNSAAAPYFNSSSCGTPGMYSWAQLHMNGESFQLIAAGADGTYGTAVAGFPGDIPSNPPAFPHGPFVSPKSNTGHEDNITNFASGRLKEAAEKLLQ